MTRSSLPSSPPALTRKSPSPSEIEEPRDANLFTDARERAESQKEPAAVPAPEEDGEASVRSTIFKIFNK